jgi:hypothetical protein
MPGIDLYKVFVYDLQGNILHSFYNFNERNSKEMYAYYTRKANCTVKIEPMDILFLKKKD